MKQQRQEAAALRSGRRRPSQRGEGRREVDVQHLVAVPARDRRDWVVAHDYWNPHALLVRDDLGPPAMLAPQVAVVRHEHDHGVVKPPRLAQRPHDVTHRGVHREERAILVQAEPVEHRTPGGVQPGQGPQPLRLVRGFGLVVTGRAPSLQAGKGVAVLGSRDGRSVGGGGGKVQEQRARRAVDEARRLAGQHVG